MKKILYGTTALVAVGVVAGDAAMAAEPIKLGLGGYMRQWVGYADNDNHEPLTAGDMNGRDYHGVDQQSDSEIYVTGSTKLDNGITISVTMELEADTGAGTSIDESYIKASSDTLGALIIGGKDSVTAIGAITAPDVGIGLTGAAGRWQNWIRKPAAIATNASATTALGATAPGSPAAAAPDTYFNPGDDANKVSYLSPRFYGLGVGYSYTPDTSDNANVIQDKIASGGGEAHAFIAMYDNKFGDIGVGLEVGYGRTGQRDIDTGAATLTWSDEGWSAWQVGGKLTYAGFTLSGSFIDVDSNATNNGTFGNTLDGFVWDAGLSYKTGPYGVSLAYLSEKQEGLLTNTGDDTTEVWMGSGSYTLGPGIDVKASVFYVTYEDEVSAVAANENDGWGIVGGFDLKF